MSEKSISGKVNDYLDKLGKVKQTPAKLVEDALAGFQKAADQLAVAQNAIATQKAEHEAKLREASAGVADCTAQHDRLSRVRDRIKDFLA